MVETLGSLVGPVETLGSLVELVETPRPRRRGFVGPRRYRESMSDVTGSGRPADRASLRAWVDSLPTEELAELAREIVERAVVSGHPATGGFDALDPAAVVWDNPVIAVGEPPGEDLVLTVRVEVVGSDPLIWRKVDVVGELGLDEVHFLLQALFGWVNLHLHRFSRDPHAEAAYFLSEEDEDEGDSGTPERCVRVDQVLSRIGEELTYRYDLGDGWCVRLRLEATRPTGKATSLEPLAVCLDGEQAAPVEDAGGAEGWNEIVAWLRAGKPADRLPWGYDDPMLLEEWLHPGFDPDVFDIAGTNNDIVARLLDDAGASAWGDFRPRAAEVIAQLPLTPTPPARWLSDETWSRPLVVSPADAAVAVRPFKALLDAVGDGVGLTAAGYLPPAVVSRMVEESGVGLWWPGKGNREDATPPVALVRRLGVSLGLLRQTTRRLEPTAYGRTLSHDPVGLLQHLCGKLPKTTTELGTQAGVLYLLAVASGAQESDELDRALRDSLRLLGWRSDDDEPISLTSARQAVEPTRLLLRVFDGVGGFPDPGPPAPETRALLRLVARVALEDPSASGW